MEELQLSKALSTLRIKNQSITFESFAADGFRIQDIIEKAPTSLHTVASKPDRQAASETLQNWDQTSNLLASFQRYEPFFFLFSLSCWQRGIPAHRQHALSCQLIVLMFVPIGSIPSWLNWNIKSSPAAAPCKMASSQMKQRTWHVLQ